MKWSKLGLLVALLGCSSSEGTTSSGTGGSGFQGENEGGSGGSGGTKQEGGTAGKATGATGGASGSDVGSNSGGTNSGSGGAGGSTPSGGASGKGASGTGGSSIDLKDPCYSYASSLCNKHYECEPLEYTTYFQSKFDCISRFASTCLQAAELPGANVDKTLLSVCSFGIEVLSCRQLAIREFPASCSAMGTLKEGAVCSHDWQCSSGPCSVAPGASCGHCIIAQATNNPCYDDHDCQSGCGCIQGQCLQYQAEGAPCAGLPCEPGLGCSGFSIKTCKQPPNLGGACDPEDLAAPSVCNPKAAAYCGVVTNKCIAYQYVKEGASCAVDNFEAAVACVGSRCLTSNGTCTAYQTDGATCNSSSSCLPPATCGSGKCTLVNPNCQ